MDKQNEKLERLLAPLRADKLAVPEGTSPPEEHGHSDSFTTIRKATHQDKEIEIHTTYKILLDGEPLMAHTMVLDDGTVHYHGLPQYSFASAMDMARKIIETSDVELPDDDLGRGYTQHTNDKET